MINRELIRLKVVQLVYSLVQRGIENSQVAENELQLSMSQAYDLYQHLLLLFAEVHRVALQIEEMRVARAARLKLPQPAENRILTGGFINQLVANKQLIDYRDSQKSNWYDQNEFVRNLYKDIEQSDLYANYQASGDKSYEADRNFWRQVYRKFICNNETLDNLLEDQNLYWNDDRVVIDTFIDKTIGHFKENEGADMPLLPDFSNDEDRQFAFKLLAQTIRQQDKNMQLIESNARNWEMDRIALMDRVILSVALAELISFPDIPVPVTISVYVEIAKDYSTPKSSKYIHATLDAIAKQLMIDKKLIKS